MVLGVGDKMEMDAESVSQSVRGWESAEVDGGGFASATTELIKLEHQWRRRSTRFLGRCHLLRTRNEFALCSGERQHPQATV